MPNDQAFAKFLRLNQGIIRAYAASLGIPWHAIDEVAQEAFVQYYLSQSRQPEGVEPLRWLKSIARNCAINWMRSRKSAPRLVALTALLEPAEDLLPGKETGSSPSIAALKSCLRSLPEERQQVLKWYYLDNLATEIIAERLRQTASSVRTQVMRMREALGNCIRRRLSGEHSA